MAGPYRPFFTSVYTGLRHRWRQKREWKRFISPTPGAWRSCFSPGIKWACILKGERDGRPVISWLRRKPTTGGLLSTRDCPTGFWPSIGRTSRRFTFMTKPIRSEEHTSELQSRPHLVCRLLLEKKKYNNIYILLLSI